VLSATVRGPDASHPLSVATVLRSGRSSVEVQASATNEVDESRGVTPGPVSDSGELQARSDEEVSGDPGGVAVSAVAVRTGGDGAEVGAWSACCCQRRARAWHRGRGAGLTWSADRAPLCRADPGEGVRRFGPVAVVAIEVPAAVAVTTIKAITAAVTIATRDVVAIREVVVEAAVATHAIVAVTAAAMATQAALAAPPVVAATAPAAIVTEAAVAALVVVAITAPAAIAIPVTAAAPVVGAITAAAMATPAAVAATAAQSPLPVRSRGAVREGAQGAAELEYLIIISDSPPFAVAVAVAVAVAGLRSIAVSGRRWSWCPTLAACSACPRRLAQGHCGTWSSRQSPVASRQSPVASRLCFSLSGISRSSSSSFWAADPVRPPSEGLLPVGTAASGAVAV
jgi:hypothetical protein